MDIAIRVLALAATSMIIGGVCVSDYLGMDTFFTWHPVFMSVGTVLLLSLGVVSYVSNLGRGLNAQFPDRPSRRVVHGVIQFSAVICLLLGFLSGWATHERFHVSQIAADGSNLIKAHVWLGYFVLLLAVVNAVLGQYKFVVKARDNKTIAPYHGHIGSVAYLVGMLTVMLGVAHVFLHMTSSALQHALGITIIVLLCVLLLLVLLEVLCLPQVESNKGVSGDYGGHLDHYSMASGDYRTSLNGGPR